MKKIILSVLVLILTVGYGFSQDVITKKTGDDIQAKIIEVTSTQIKYNRFDNLNGPVYSIDKSEVIMIRYENGTKDIFTNADNANTEPVAKSDKSEKVKSGTFTNKKYNNWFGLTGGGGAGFSSVQMVTLNDGSKGSISFGSGTLVQFEYGHKFNRQIELKIGLGGQFSELDKTISNGSVNFNRSIVSITPSYLLYLAGGDKMCLKFGAGVDFLYNALMSMKLASISGGFDDDWKYKSTVGEHICLLFEYNTPKRFSLDAGINLHNANYEFNSGGSTYPTTEDLKKPKGSGVEFLVGAYYRFNWKK